MREYAETVNRRRIGVLLLLVLLLLGLGLGGLDDGDGGSLALLPESDVEVSETTPTPAPTETPTPAPGGGGGGDGAAGGSDDSSGDGDGSSGDDVLLQDSESTGDGETTEDTATSTPGSTDKDPTSSVGTPTSTPGPSTDTAGGGGGGGGGGHGASSEQSNYNHDEHLYLEVVGDRLRVEATNVLPGDEGSESATLTNNGTVNGTLLAAFDNVTDAENGLTEPEQETGDSGSDGELSEHLEVRLSVTPEGGSEEYLFGNDTEYVTLSNIQENSNMTDGVLDAGENATVTLDWRLPKETGNEVQTDRVTFDLVFYLIHNEQGV